MSMEISDSAETVIAAIRSGGQSGADRGALDAALANGVAIEGWCPAGGWAEDYTEVPGILADYLQLTETPSADPAQRTERNVRDSDVTLIIAPSFRGASASSPGTRLTVELAESYGKSCRVVDGDSHKQVLETREWLAEQGAELTLNVAGPRESECPGVYRLAFDVISAVLTHN
jgi:hypothetical protein